MNGGVVLRVVRAEIIEAETAEALQSLLNDWFKQGGQRTFLQAYHLAALTMLILYAEG